MSGDDYGRLRGALADLAEHGGSPDLYDRAVRTSRRLRRRAALATAGTAAAVALAIGAGVVAFPGARLPAAPPGAPVPATAASPEVVPTAPSHGPEIPDSSIPLPPEKPLEQTR